MAATGDQAPERGLSDSQIADVKALMAGFYDLAGEVDPAVLFVALMTAAGDVGHWLVANSDGEETEATVRMAELVMTTVRASILRATPLRGESQAHASAPIKVM